MPRFIIEYAALGGSPIEHIWKRRPKKGLWHALCGRLSDGQSMHRTNNLAPCPLCEKIWRIEYAALQGQVRHA